MEFIFTLDSSWILPWRYEYARRCQRWKVSADLVVVSAVQPGQQYWPLNQSSLRHLLKKNLIDQPTLKDRIYVRATYFLTLFGYLAIMPKSQTRRLSIVYGCTNKSQIWVAGRDCQGDGPPDTTLYRWWTLETGVLCLRIDRDDRGGYLNGLETFNGVEKCRNRERRKTRHTGLLSITLSLHTGFFQMHRASARNQCQRTDGADWINNEFHFFTIYLAILPNKQ